MKIKHSRPASDVYKRFCVSLLEKQKRLDFLDRCGLGARQITTPSWVPDWSISVDRNVRLPYADIFHTAGTSTAEVRLLDSQQSIMQVTGAVCGTIKIVGRKAPAESSDFLEAVRSWQPEDLWTGLYPNGEALSFAFVSLLGLAYLIERWPQCNSL